MNNTGPGGRPQGPRQLDIQWMEPEAFTLVIQQTTDGELIAAQQAESAANKEQSDKQQITFS